MSKNMSKNLRGFAPNNRVDERFHPRQFFRQKGRVEDNERIEKKFQRKLEKGKF